MDREQLQFYRPPFQESADPAFFYPGGMRQEVLEEIKKALSEEVPLLTLTGADGTGKTMLCRVLEKELPAGLISVYLPRLVFSFDEMVGLVAGSILGERGDAVEKPATATLLREVVQTLRERGQRLLILCDDADRIFLATLERVRRMLDQVNVDGVVLQLLLAGNSQLADNLDQLGIVAFEEVAERHFVLDPIDPETTWLYLNNCIRIAAGEERQLFSRDLVDRVFAPAEGNFARINDLAREALQAEKPDTSFFALLDAVEAEPQSGGKAAKPVRRIRTADGLREVNLDFLKFPEIKGRWLVFGGGACGLILLLFLLIGRPGSEDSPPAGSGNGSDVPVIELRPVEPLDTPVFPEAAPEPGIASSSGDPDRLPSTAGEPVPSTRATETAPAPAEAPAGSTAGSEPEEPEPKEPAAGGDMPAGVAETEPEPVHAETVEAEPILPEAPEIEPTLPEAAEPATTETEKRGGKAAIPAPVVTDSSPARAIEPVAVDRAEPGPEPETIVVEPIGKKKQPSVPAVVAILETDQKKIPVTAAPVDQPEAGRVPATASPDAAVEDIYQRRLAAGARWLVGAGAGKFTVQLMVLTSEQAEDNLKLMLQEDDYRAVADELFILRRVGSLSTVMVFYGEYPTLASARNARNTLPVFLRKHNPYAISVRGAVEKTKASL